MTYRFEIFLPSVLSYLFNYDPAAVVHEFSIDLSGKHMVHDVRQKYGAKGPVLIRSRLYEPLCKPVGNLI